MLPEIQQPAVQQVIWAIAERAETKPTGLWCASVVKPPIHIMTEAHLSTNGLLAIETYKNIESGSTYARIYGTPATDHIPTIVVGDVRAVAIIVSLDQQPMLPLHPKISVRLGSRTLSYSDLLLLPGLDGVLKQKRLGVLRRKSTFVLTEMLPWLVGGVEASVKVYRNMLLHRTRDEYFAQVRASDEREPVSVLEDGTPVYGWVLTDSNGYALRHPELQLQQIQ